MKASDNIFPKVTLVEGSAPSSPPANDFHLYVDSSDHLLKYKNSAGTVTTLGAGLVDPMTTRGDIIVRNASNVTARLAVGGSGTVLSSDGTDVSWQAGGGGGGSLLSMDLLAFWPSSASTATASESLGGIHPAWAFQEATAVSLNGWLDNGSALPQWLGIQFPAAVVCTSYALIPWNADNYPGRAPKTWTFQGSNDGSSWTTLDTQTNYTAWASSAERTAFSFSNSTAYSYYRINVSANQGNAYMGIARMWLYGPVRIAQT